jgi:hypothetical protein
MEDRHDAPKDVKLPPDREARLAQALRANLKRRKAPKATSEPRESN